MNGDEREMALSIAIRDARWRRIFARFSSTVEWSTCEFLRTASGPIRGGAVNDDTGRLSFFFFIMRGVLFLRVCVYRGHVGEYLILSRDIFLFLLLHVVLCDLLIVYNLWKKKKKHDVMLRSFRDKF